MKLFLAAAGALAAVSPIAAQTPPPPVVTLPAPDPAAVDAARDLLRSVNFEGQMEQTAQQAARATFDTVTAAEEARQGKRCPPTSRPPSGR
jgi:membrane-bound lytic murein transglycosylase B